jgi:selenocysteine lyase/cysteine desulfurase
MNRRHLFQLASQVAAGATAAQLFVPSASAGTPAEEDFWASIRNEFTTDRTVVNLNNGYASPAPRTVQEAVRRYTDYTNMGPYHTMIRELEPKVETARRMIAETAGCDPEEIAITRNSSESLEIAQFGLELKPGDEVVTTNQDYPRMITTYQQRERRDGIKLKQISFPVPVTSMDDLYDRFEKAITPKTKVMHFCHITNRTGQIFPVRRLCDLAASRGIISIVDGAHAFSQFPYKISDFNCDYYGVSLHKWTFAPMGTGFLYVKRSRIKDTWPLFAAGPGQRDNIRKFEEIGTHPAAIHNGICEAIAFNRGIGIERKAARLRYLRDRWAAGFADNPKISILHNPAPEMSCGIGMIGVKGDVSKLTSVLQSKYGIYLGMMGHEEYTGIRITASVYTTVQEIDYFINAVNKETPNV